MKILFQYRLQAGVNCTDRQIFKQLQQDVDTAGIKAVDEFAQNLGVAFQIQDDILDVTGDEKELGKPIGSDAEENKNTYVKLVGLEKSKELAKEYSEKAKKSLEMFGEKAEFLINLTDYLIDRKF